MKLRAASVSFALAFVFTSLPAQAQGPGGPPLNFPQLASAVATLQNQVATLQGAVTTLQGRVAKLEGNITASDLVGTYTLTVIDTALSALVPGVPVRNANIQTLTATGSVALNADGSASVVSFTCSSSKLTQGAWTLTSIGCGDPPTISSWTYADGIVTVTGGDLSGLQFNVGLGGRLLVATFTDFHTADASSDSPLFMLTRLH